MGGFVTAAVAVGGISMYAADQANSAADQRAADANAANSAAASRSRELSVANAAKRKEELLRRFNISSSNLSDSNAAINMGLATQLTSMDLAISKSASITDNALATKHITGRLAERMQNAMAIQGDSQRGTAIQAAEQAHRDVGAQLETMGMNYESESMNLDIDLSNSMTSINNSEVANYSYSASTGIGGVLSSGISGAASGLSLAAGYKKLP